MLGHIQSAYTARVSRDLTLSSRFDFNVYSYDSEWTMGAEWWLRRSPRGHKADDELEHEEDEKPSASFPSSLGEVHGVVKARASTNNVRIDFLCTSEISHEHFVGCVPDVGRSNTPNAGRLGCSLGLVKQGQAHQGHWVRSIVFQL